MGSVGLMVKLSPAKRLMVVVLRLVDSDFSTASNLTVHLQPM